MDVNEMKQLLDRFYEGQTDDAEEKTLRDAVLGNEVTEEDCEDAFLASLYSNTEIPEGLERRLGRQIDNWNSVERSFMRRTRAASIKWIAGIAAAFLILLSVGLMLNESSDSKEYTQKDTYDNAQDAYAQTQKALMEMSESLNKGFEKMEEATNKN